MTLVRRHSGFAIVLVLILLFHWSLGTYESDFGRYQDEGAHYITGLLVRQFALTPSSWMHPMAFAKDYYVHYPKVSFGQWPPLFYIMQTAWTIPFGPSRLALLLMMSVLMACLVWSVYRLVRDRLGRMPAFMAASVAMLVPLSQTQTAMVMAEVPLALFSLWAVVAWSRYLDTPSHGQAIRAALWTTAALMTKGNAWDIPLAIGLLVLIYRRWDLLLSRTLWIAVALIAALCIPYYAATLAITSQGWDASTFPGVWYTVQSLGIHLRMSAESVGLPMALLACVGWWMGRREKVWMSMGIYATAIVLFHGLLPTSIEPRKIYQIVPVLAILVGVAMSWLASLKTARALSPMLALAGLAVFFVSGYKREPAFHPGFREAIASIRAQPGAVGSAVFLSSNPFRADDEAALIAEWAQYEPTPRTYLIRATKLLGQLPEYRMPSTDPKDVDAIIAQLPVSFMLLSTAQAPRVYEHHQVVRTLAQQNTLGWELQFSHATPERELLVYRNRREWAGLPVHYSLDLTKKIGESLEAGSQ